MRSERMIPLVATEEKSFLIVLSGCSGLVLKERAEQVRSAIGCLAFATSHGAIPVSVSVGVVTIENWDKSLSIEPYLKQADAALYQAKADGRDRVVYAERPIVMCVP
jgi:diguanylate cyclase (GGDEF)-like protein